MPCGAPTQQLRNCSDIKKFRRDNIRLQFCPRISSFAGVRRRTHLKYSGSVRRRDSAEHGLTTHADYGTQTGRGGRCGNLMETRKKRPWRSAKGVEGRGRKSKISGWLPLFVGKRQSNAVRQVRGLHEINRNYAPYATMPLASRMVFLLTATSSVLS